MNSIKKQILFLLVLIVSYSCTSELDLNQANDLKAEPVFVTNFAYFNVPAANFVTNGVENTINLDSPTVTVFDSSFFEKNLNRVDLFYEFNNTTSRAFTVEVSFKDLSGNVLHSILTNVPAYTGTTNIVNGTEIFLNTDLDILRSTQTMTFSVVLEPGTLLTETSTGTLKLRSSVTAYIVQQ